MPAPDHDRADRIGAVFAQLNCVLVTDESGLNRVADLRYRAYLNAGMIRQNQVERLTDEFDTSPNAHIFEVWHNADLVASLRIHVVARLGTPTSPAVSVFSDILWPSVAKGLCIIDTNRLVVDPVFGRRVPNLHLALMRISVGAALHFQADMATATVRPGHQTFYSRVLRMRVAAQPRPYPSLIKALCLMTVNCRAEAAEVFRNHPYLHPTLTEPGKLFGPVCQLTFNPPSKENGHV